MGKRRGRECPVGSKGSDFDRLWLGQPSERGHLCRDLNKVKKLGRYLLGARAVPEEEQGQRPWGRSVLGTFKATRWPVWLESTGPEESRGRGDQRQNGPGLCRTFEATGRTLGFITSKIAALGEFWAEHMIWTFLKSHSDHYIETRL